MTRPAHPEPRPVFIRGPAMTNAARIAKRGPRPSALEVFVARAEARAILWQCAEFDLHEAVDVLWDAAEHNGLVDQVGQDRVQKIISKAFGAVR